MMHPIEISSQEVTPYYRYNSKDETYPEVLLPINNKSE
jgi:hypothetical protein